MILQNVCAFKSKKPPTVMETKDNRNEPHHSEHLSIWFSQSVQHRTKCIMNRELRHLHCQRYDPAVFTNAAINLNHQTLTSTNFFFWREKKTKDIYAGAANRAGTLEKQRAACCSSSNKAAAWAAWAFGAGACSWLVCFTAHVITLVNTLWTPAVQLDHQNPHQFQTSVYWVLENLTVPFDCETICRSWQQIR